MRMFGPLALAAAFFAMPAMAVGQITPSPNQQSVLEGPEREKKPARKRINLGLAASSPKWKRGRGTQAKPKRKRNLVTHSRRIRRKHRRASKAA